MIQTRAETLRASIPLVRSSPSLEAVVVRAASMSVMDPSPRCYAAAVARLRLVETSSWIGMPVTSETLAMCHCGIVCHCDTAERVMPRAAANFAALPIFSIARITVGSVIDRETITICHSVKQI
jgi:hypothetical protein